MKSISLTIAALCLFALIACDKTETPEKKEPIGKIAFYTNAQNLLFCDSIHVKVFVDSIWVGTITKACSADTVAQFNASDSILLVDKKPGTHSYYAVSNCGDSVLWKSSLNVTEDSIQPVFLNVWEVANDVTKTHIKLIGTWRDYRTEGNIQIIFTKKDTVIEYSGDRIWGYGLFKVVAPDSIEATRPYLSKVYSKHKITFTGNDTLRLRQFTRVGVGITGYDDRFLKRIK